MNRLNFNQSVGFPIETDILDEMQKAYTLFNALGFISGNFSIISGCGITGTTVADGVVFINGEVLNFVGGTVQENVIIVEVKTALEFEDLSTHDVVYTRHATFGTATEQWLWADFKPSFPTKNIPAALDEKLDIAELTVVVERITELEKQTAVFRAGGGMVMWKRPAINIPSGWQEVVNWRGRMPLGWNPDDEDFITLGGIGGAKEVQLVAANIPELELTATNTAGGTEGGGFVTTGNGTEGAMVLGKTANGTTKVDIMNPYRLVMFIEYIYTAPTPPIP